MRRNGLLSLAAVVMAMLAGASCVDSGHLLGNAHGTGGQAPAGAGGSATSTGGSTSTGGAIGDSASGGTAGTGEIPGSGGASTMGAAGTSGTGGSATGGAPVGTGGAVQTGGTTGSGGISASGGAGPAGGTGGATTGTACGGPSGGTCPVGQFCDLASSCGMVSGAAGVCMPFGWNVTCSDQATPVCGCEGKTYVNDCQRAAAGMLKAMDGVCADNGFSYPNAYLAWQSTVGGTGSGPAAAVNAPDWLITWDSTATFPPESPLANPTAMHPLDINNTDDLFLRLAGVNVSVLPHGSAVTADCQATLYFRLCNGCAINTLTYGSADQIAPEMEVVWSWFDTQIDATAPVNPRNYCRQ